MQFPQEFSFAGHGTIRFIAASDLPALEWHGQADLRQFYHQLYDHHCNGTSTALIADINGFPAGQILIHWSGKPAHLDFPDQQSLRVHPAFRGVGLGSRLIRASEGFVASRGYANVGLSVNVANENARRLYERLGYNTLSTPYEDQWRYINAAGEEVVVTETVLDMVKAL